MRAALLAMECPTFDTQPWVAGPALSQRRVALISTAGLHRREDRPFAVTSGNARAVAGDYRVIPHDISLHELRDQDGRTRALDAALVPTEVDADTEQLAAFLRMLALAARLDVSILVDG